MIYMASRREAADDRRRMLARALHGRDQLLQLRDRADALRTQVIAFNARLMLAAATRDDLQPMRAQLIDGAARIDHAVRGILVTAAPRSRAR